MSNHVISQSIPDFCFPSILDEKLYELGLEEEIVSLFFIEIVYEFSIHQALYVHHVEVNLDQVLIFRLLALEIQNLFMEFIFKLVWNKVKSKFVPSLQKVIKILVEEIEFLLLVLLLL